MESVIGFLLRKNGIKPEDIIDFSDILYSGLSDSEKVKEINRMVRENSDIYLPKYVVMYHGTAQNLREGIGEKGLLPTSASRRRSYQSANGYVYLAATFGRAKTFGDLGNMSRSDVYAVLLKVTELKADLDQIHNMIAANPDFKIGRSVGDSLIYGGGVRVKGSIPCYRLEMMEEPRMSFDEQVMGAELKRAQNVGMDKVNHMKVPER